VRTGPGLTDLTGKRIAFLWDMYFRGDEIFEILKTEINSRYEDVSFVDYQEFGPTSGDGEEATIAGLADTLRAKGVDAIVSGVGACGSCTAAVVRASLVAENAGIHSVTILGRGFGASGRAVAKLGGIPDLLITEYPGVIMTDTDEQFDQKVRTSLVDQILTGLAYTATPVTQEAEALDEIVFKGTFAEVQRYYESHEWTDGLPVVPPTQELVREFLDNAAGLDPAHSFGRLLPSTFDATVYSIAVNGVMAGCPPESMPVLMAAVECILDPKFRLQDGGSTPGIEPQIVVGGPIIQQLGMHYGQGVLRVGHRINTSVGRFLRLYMRNMAGFRTPPGGATDKATFGTTFNVVLCEDEAAARRIGWDPFSVTERGFSDGDNVVTVMQVESWTPPMYSRGTTAVQHLQKIAEVYGSMAAHWTCCGLTFGAFPGLLILSPAVAEVLARDGLSKDDVRQYLYENCKVSMDVVHRYAADPGNERIDLDRVVSLHPECEVYREESPNGLVPVFPWPEQIGILVAGDPDRNQSRAILGNHMQGFPVSKRVRS
jgi:hypothetical protein